MNQISIVQIYHLGTVAFGSLILAIIRTIKTILEYIEKKCKKFNNDLTKWVLSASTVPFFPCIHILLIQMPAEVLPVLPLVS